MSSLFPFARVYRSRATAAALTATLVSAFSAGAPFLSAQSPPPSPAAPTAPAPPPLPGLSPATTPAAPGGAAATAEARLRFWSNTYQANLKTIEAPVIRDYLRELDTLRQTLVKGNRLEDLPALDAEIARVKKLSSTSGVLELPPPPAPPVAPKPGAPPPPGKDGSKPPTGGTKPPPAALALLANDAKPAPGVTLPESPVKNAVALLGKVSWNVSRLPAGNYDLMVLYACAKTEDGLTLQAQWNNDQTLTAHLTDRQSTGSDKNFRVLRLGQVTLEKEANDVSVTLEAPPENILPIYVRSLVFAKPKPKAPPAKGDGKPPSPEPKS